MPKPKTGKVYLCTVECTSGGGHTVLARLRKVNEDDCDWRTEDDNSELGNNWYVLSWQEVT